MAHLRVRESTALFILATTARGAEQQALLRRCWSALLSLIAVLQRRLEAHTLLPGTVRKKESDYYAHVQAGLYSAQNKPAPPPAVLHASASTLGYIVLLSALRRSLNLLEKTFQSLWPSAQRNIVESFVRAFLSSPPTCH